MVTATPDSPAIARGAAVSISHLHHAFTLGKQTVPVLENISLQLRPGKAWRCWPFRLRQINPAAAAGGAGSAAERTDADRRRGARRPGAGADPCVSGSDALPMADGTAERAAGPAGAGQKGLEAKADALIDRIGLQAFSEAWPRQLSGDGAACGAGARLIERTAPAAARRAVG